MWLLITVTKNPLRFFLLLWELCVNWKVWWIYCYITLKKPRVKCSTLTLNEYTYLNIYFISLDFIRVTHLYFWLMNQTSAAEGVREHRGASWETRCLFGKISSYEMKGFMDWCQITTTVIHPDYYSPETGRWWRNH